MRTDSQPVKNSNESGTARPNKDARGNSIRRVNREPGGKKKRDCISRYEAEILPSDVRETK